MSKIEDKIKYLKDRLNFYESFNVTPGKVWIQPTNGLSLQQEIEKINNQLEVLDELNQNKDEY